ncbi:hypothetical protein [Intestinibacter bartlettii]|uniref:hypothetical protein n=1 Tax=Intestinibacter bartlettii TaxID=261299 RepID=UPI0039F504A1
MCWTGDDTAVRKIAERDFYVYKIGKIIWNNIFISDIRGHYYAPIRPNKIVPLIAYSPCIGVYRIDRGYHSYKWVALEDTYPNERCLCLGNYNSALKENISLYKGCCIATFVIPKNSVFFINEMGTIISNYIRYTGKYIKL